MPPASDYVEEAQAALARGDVNQAKLGFRRGLTSGNREAALAGLARIAEAEGDWRALHGLALDWGAANRSSAEPLRMRARAAWELGDARAAAAAFEIYVQRSAPSAALLTSLARLYIYAFEYNKAAAALREAEALDATHADALAAQASLAMILGEMDAARAYCRRALNLNSREIAALRVLVQVDGDRLSQSEAAALADLAGDDSLSLDDRVSVQFMLGDCLDAQSRFEEAFAAYDRAHTIARAQAPAYDPSRQVARTDQLIEMLGWSVSLPTLDPDSGLTPIFIVGMPRSGTTLIESVLGAHPAVRAFGERDTMRRIAHEAEQVCANGGVLSADMLRAWRAAYLAPLPALNNACAIVDKNPWNFDATWLIAKMFPNARIIHVRRNAVETGLSIYRNQFPKFMAFTNSLADIGHYYGRYARLMAAASAAQGQHITTVQYEEFVGAFDEAAPRLVAQCGLPWDAACAHFWTSQRPIATMSVTQARQPVRRDATRAARYAAYLRPLIAALQASDVDPETGCLRLT